MTELSDHRWEGYSLEQKQAWLRQGQGPGAARPAGDFLGSLAKRYGQTEATLEHTLGELDAIWSGAAADVAAATLAGVAARTGEGQRTSTQGALGVGRYGASYQALLAKVPTPDEVGDGSLAAVPGDDLGAVTGLHADYRDRLLTRQRADRLANDALYQHQSVTREALTAIGVPEPRPETRPQPRPDAADRVDE